MDECKPLSPGAAGFLDLLSAFLPAPLADCVDTSRRWQGLTLVHLSSQPEPFLTQNTP